MTTEELKPEETKPAATKVPSKKPAAKKTAAKKTAKKAAKKKSPAKKPATNGATKDHVTLADLAKKAKVEPRLARRRLRDAEVKKEGGQWSWPKSKEAQILKVISGE